MNVQKFKTKREHIKALVTIKSILKYDFNMREIELATEFLHFAYLYSKKPLEIEGHEFDSIFRMVKYRTTLQKITINLDMSFSALRKYKIPISTGQRAIRNLSTKGYLEKHSSTKYTLGDKFYSTFPEYLLKSHNYG